MIVINEAKKFVEALRVKCSEQGDCNSCAKSDYCYYGGDYAMRNEAADLIESLAAELEQVKQERDGLNIMLGQAQSMLETRTRERDAAVEDLNMCCPCEVCARSCQYDKVNPYDECADFMWRGTKEE